MCAVVKRWAGQQIYVPRRKRNIHLWPEQLVVIALVCHSLPLGRLFFAATTTCRAATSSGAGIVSTLTGRALRPKWFRWQLCTQPQHEPIRLRYAPRTTVSKPELLASTFSTVVDLCFRAHTVPWICSAAQVSLHRRGQLSLPLCPKVFVDAASSLDSNPPLPLQHLQQAALRHLHGERVRSAARREPPRQIRTLCYRQPRGVGLPFHPLTKALAARLTTMVVRPAGARHPNGLSVAPPAPDAKRISMGVWCPALHRSSAHHPPRLAEGRQARGA